MGVVEEGVFIGVMTLVAVGVYAHMAYFVAIEMSRELKIPIFSVPRASDTIPIV